MIGKLFKQEVHFMDDPAGFWGLLKNGLAILNSYKAIIDYGPKLLGLGSGLVKRRWYDIDELFPNLMEGNLSLGDIVECSGFLSKYSQTFLPMSYAPLVSGPSSEKVLLRKIENGRVTEKRQLTTIANALQIPIKVIPSSGNIKLCFLYSDDFDSFIYPVDDGSTNPESKNKIIVPKSGQPIPVLIDINRHSGLIDKFVDIKAKIIAIPDDLVQKLGDIYEGALAECNKCFYDPYAEIGSFICLSLLDSSPSIKSFVTKNDVLNTKAQVFVELHVEGLEQCSMKTSRIIIENSIPDLVSDGIKIIKFQGREVIPYLTKGAIRFIFKEPNIIGLYTTIDVFDNVKYHETISELHRYSQVLSRKLQTASVDVIGTRLKTVTDFVFDPSKANLFDSRGVLNLNKHEFDSLGPKSLQDTISWYQKG